MSSENLLLILRSLECELQKPAVRHNVTRLDELIHPDFKEFGASGSVYTKADVLNYAVGAGSQKIESHDFALRVLGLQTALLTYASAYVNETGTLERQTLRSSIWQLEPTGWQIIFHQGTLKARREL